MLVPQLRTSRTLMAWSSLNEMHSKEAIIRNLPMFTAKFVVIIDLNFFLKTHRKYLQAINSISTAEKAIKTKADAKSLRFVGIDYIFRSSENAFSSSFRKFYYR